MLGTRSHQDMWINQAQMFGEVHRLIGAKGSAKARFRDGRGWNLERGYGFVRDVFKAARNAFGEAWGDNRRYMVTRDVTIKALLRLAGDAAKVAPEEIAPGPELLDWLEKRFRPWTELVRDFKREGFYERFPARGQVERVEKVRKHLGREARLE
jgi:hypothetical protein